MIRGHSAGDRSLGAPAAFCFKTDFERPLAWRSQKFQGANHELPVAGIRYLRRPWTGAAGLRPARAHASAGGGRQRHLKRAAGTAHRCWAMAKRWRASGNWAWRKCSCRRRARRACPPGTGWRTAVTNLARQNPAALAWGDDGRVARLFGNESALAAPDSGPLTDFIIRQDNREAALAHLQGSTVAVGAGIVAHPVAQGHQSFSRRHRRRPGQSFDTAVLHWRTASGRRPFDGGLEPATFPTWRRRPIAAAAPNRWNSR